MQREEIIDRFCQMGSWITEGLQNRELGTLTQRANAENGWFCPRFVHSALQGIALWLQKDVLDSFVSRYPFAEKSKNVAIIAAGNLPAVGFHDIMCVLLAGHKAICKLSHKDSIILPALFGKFFPQEVVFENRTLQSFDAVIATGSNNSALHFQSYFSKYPHIIRHNRNSIAVLSGSETEEELQGLAQDMLLYAGLGCRSVSKLFLPSGYDFTPLKKACQSFAWLGEMNKYRNNLDYHKAIFIMNNLPFEDLGTVLLIESEDLACGVSVVTFQYYNSIEQVKEYMGSKGENLQVVLSSIPTISHYTLGTAQSPAINDYADGIDTMLWLSRL